MNTRGWWFIYEGDGPKHIAEYIDSNSTLEWLASLGYILEPAVVMSKEQYEQAIESAYKHGFDQGRQ